MSDTTMDQFISTLPANIRKNVTVVTPDDIGQVMVYHISTDPGIRKFRPEVSRRTAQDEDRSVPRVSTATSITGCIQAYQGDVFDFNTVPSKDSGYLGGWYIYGFEFKVALKPNGRVVYDAPYTNEIWLVPYQENEWEKRSRVLGKFFYQSMVHSWNRGRRYVQRTCLVEIKDSAPVHFAKDTWLDKGFWKVVLGEVSVDTPWDKVDVVSAEKITRGEFQEAKTVAADLLSMPPSAQW